jgi:hypothetical protein
MAASIARMVGEVQQEQPFRVDARERMIPAQAEGRGLR